MLPGVSRESALQRFLRKSPQDRASAVASTCRDFYRRFKNRRTRRLIGGPLAAPAVIGSQSRVYVAYRPDWDVEYDRMPELKALSENWVANNRYNNGGDLPRLYALLLNISQVMSDGVAGDFAEVGVYRGNSAAILAHYARQNGRSAFLFDTYEGFEGKDLTGIDAGKAMVFEDTSVAMVRQTVGDGDVTYVKGYFPDTVTDDIAARRYAVVHLDCDLYAPIKAGLEFFYSRLSPGGIIVIHDYANPYWDGTKRAVDEFLPGIRDGLVLMPDKSGTAIIRKSR